MHNQLRWMAVILSGFLILACDDGGGGGGGGSGGSGGGGGSAGGDAGLEGPTANLRIVHLGRGAPGVDVFVNGEGPVLSNLTFGNASAVLAAPAGVIDAQISATGTPASAAVVTLQDIPLEENRSYTAVAFGEVASLQANAFEDDRLGLATGHVRVRVIHAADGVPTVDVYEIKEGSAPEVLAENLRYGTPGEPVDLPTDPFVVGVDTNDDQVPELTFNVPGLPEGTVVNVFAALNASGTVALFAQLADTTAWIEPNAAQLRVLHLGPDAPAVTPLVDGALPTGFGALTFTQSSGYATLGAGTHAIQVTTDGTPGTAVLEAANLGFEEGKRYTAVALGRVAGLRAAFFEDSTDGLAAGNIRVRAIHGAPDVGQVDVLNVAPDGSATPVLSNVNFGDVAEPLDLPAGAYTVGVDVNDDGGPDLIFALPALNAGVQANVYVTQEAGGKVFVLAQLDGSTTARIDAATTQVRVIHMSRDAPNVDVFVNGMRAIPNLPYAESTDYLVINAAQYAVAVTAAGSPIETAVINADLTLLPGKTYTVAAIGDLGDEGERGIRPLVLEDDATGLDTATNIRIPIIHVATTVTRGDVFAVEEEGNTLLLDDIGFGETGIPPDLRSRAYTVGFDAEANGTIDVSFTLPVLAPGSFANAFVATDGDGLVYLLVQTAAAGTLRVDAN